MSLRANLITANVFGFAALLMIGIGVLPLAVTALAMGAYVLVIVNAPNEEGEGE